MFLGFAIFLILLVAWMIGVPLNNLAQLRLRGGSMVFLALLPQITLFTGLGAQIPHALVSKLHAASYVALILFVIINATHHRTLALAATGLALNALVIFANGDRMPVTLAAWTESGRPAGAITATGSYTNNVLVSRTTHFSWLGDRIVVPPPIPFATAISVGDVLIVIGVALFVIRFCGRRRSFKSTFVGRRRPRRQSTSTYVSVAASSPSTRRSRSLSSFHQPTDARTRPVPGSSRTTTPRS